MTRAAPTRGGEDEMTGRTRGWGALLGVAALVIGSLAIPQSAQAAPRCFGKRATIVGTGHRDRLQGTPGRDVIVGLGGRDSIIGKSGRDLICAGGGSDTIRGKKGHDRMHGGSGGDIIFGQAGNDEMIGAGGGDALLAGPGNDLMLAGPGFDVLIGGSGDDLFDGGPTPFDTASFEESPVGVVVDLNLVAPQVTGEGTDTLTGIEGLVGSKGNDVLTGQDLPSLTGNVLRGFGGADQLYGMDGDDVLDGEAGNDKGGPGVGLVSGGPGNDWVFGGFGDDDLYGDEGNDLLDGFEDEETTGDFGSGGPDLDECFGLESNDGTCETLAPLLAAAGRSARWRDLLLRHSPAAS